MEQVTGLEPANDGLEGLCSRVSISFAWNVARSATMIKECVKQSEIPVHADLGMGVGGVPMCEVPPTDCVTRAGKILIEIANIDGI